MHFCFQVIWIERFRRWVDGTELHSYFSEGMSKSTKRNFGCVNIASVAHSNIVDVTETVMTMEYDSVRRGVQ